MAKDFLSINTIVKKVYMRHLHSWIDRLTFPGILALWILIVIAFGFVYFFLAHSSDILVENTTGNTVSTLPGAIYFSFVTATTTGFGDVLPVGSFRLLAIFEVVFGLLLLAIVTSKLVSIKQNMILDEIYELSLAENANRIRSSLLLFRQNISRVMMRVEAGVIRRREVQDLYIYIAQLEDILNSIFLLMKTPASRRFARPVDPVNLEIVFNSMIASFEKLHEFLVVLNNHSVSWKREIIVSNIQHCIKLNRKLFGTLLNSHIPIDQILGESRTSNDAKLAAIETELAQ